jgi:hypothetical protein
MIIFQLPTQSWYDYIAKATLADVIIDLLFSCAHRFDLKVESLKKTKLIYFCTDFYTFFVFFHAIFFNTN